MNATQYKAALKNTRDMFATLGANGVYTAGRAGNASYCVTDQETDAAVEIVYNLADLYVAGFVVNDLGFSFHGKGNLFATPGSGGNFSFTEDYASMGMDRNSKWTITLGRVTDDLVTLGHLSRQNVGKFDGKVVARIVVAFAEALRFGDIERAIVQGTEFDPKTALDWKVRTKNASDIDVKVRKAA